MLKKGTAVYFILQTAGNCKLQEKEVEKQKQDEEKVKKINVKYSSSRTTNSHINNLLK